MDIKKKTHCPKCNGSLERKEHIIHAGGLWPKKLHIIYQCDSCPYASRIEIKLNKRMSRRLRYRTAPENAYMGKR